jgi:DsbC/DsbD-like thiol-disulfide interchange protein
MWACDNVAGSVFPTEDGGICLAWNNETKLTVDVQPDGSVYVHKADITIGTCEDETIPAKDDLTFALVRWLS